MLVAGYVASPAVGPAASARQGQVGKLCRASAGASDSAKHSDYRISSSLYADFISAN